MKYSVTYSCGHEGTVELFGKNSDRENKIKWYENSAKCPECYKIEKQAQNKEMGLIITINLEIYAKQYPVILIASGDSFGYRDDLKSNGYIFGDIPASGFFGLLSTSAPAKNWFKCVSIDNLQKEIDNAGAIGAKVKNGINEIDIAARAKFEKDNEIKNATEAEAEANKKTEKETALKEVEKLRPKCPAIIKSGVKFNWKIYGTKGKFNIYLDGTKTNINDTEADEIEKFNTDFKIYKTAKDAIR